MFCSNCGAEVSETASFCRKCGASLREPAPAQPVEQPPVQQGPQPPAFQQQAPQQPVAQAPVQQPQQVAGRPAQLQRPTVVQQQPAGAPVARRPFTGFQAVQPVVGIVAIAGAALAAIGSFVPWIDIEGRTGNGFDIGYITDSSGGGNDGLLVLLLALAAGALAIHYFMQVKKPLLPLLSLGTLVLGVAAAAVAGYDFIKVYKDLKDLGASSPMDYISFGLYLGFFGGLAAAAAAFMGLRREQRT
jgi:hypothetical protein